MKALLIILSFVATSAFAGQASAVEIDKVADALNPFKCGDDIVYTLAPDADVNVAKRFFSNIDDIKAGKSLEHIKTSYRYIKDIVVSWN